MIDILLNLDNNEVIIVECKTSKERGYNKFSTVSRQLKSYQNLALKNDLRIVLLHQNLVMILLLIVKWTQK